MHVPQRFERLIDTHRRPDGGRWTGQQLDVATGGVVTRSYVTNLRKGRIENPGYEKMRAIANAMGIPPKAWFEDAPGALASPAHGRDLDGRVGHLLGRSGIRDRGSPTRVRRSPAEGGRVVGSTWVTALNALPFGGLH